MRPPNICEAPISYQFVVEVVVMAISHDARLHPETGSGGSTGEHCKRCVKSTNMSVDSKRRSCFWAKQRVVSFAAANLAGSLRKAQGDGWVDGRLLSAGTL